MYLLNQSRSQKAFVYTEVNDRSRKADKPSNKMSSLEQMQQFVVA